MAFLNSAGSASEGEGGWAGNFCCRRDTFSEQSTTNPLGSTLNNPLFSSLNDAIFKPRTSMKKKQLVRYQFSLIFYFEGLVRFANIASTSAHKYLQIF
jgi:hypothetical protein